MRSCSTTSLAGGGGGSGERDGLSAQPRRPTPTVSDPEAFGLFYDRFEREVLGFFYRATRRADVAADLTAEAFAAALESAGAFDPALGSARGWLFGIARHRLADAWERGRIEDRARRRLGMDPLAVTDEMLERIEQLGSDRTVSAVELLADLPDDQRRALPGRVSRSATTQSWPAPFTVRKVSCANGSAAGYADCESDWSQHHDLPPPTQSFAGEGRGAAIRRCAGAAARYPPSADDRWARHRVCRGHRDRRRGGRSRRARQPSNQHPCSLQS